MMRTTGRDKHGRALRPGDWVKVQTGGLTNMARVSDIYRWGGPLEGLARVAFYNGASHYMGPDALCRANEGDEGDE